MTPFPLIRAAILLSCAFLVHRATVSALIFVNSGNAPVQNLGWPAGSEAVANLESRIGFWEGPPFGGGEYHFEFQAKATDEFNTALKVFSKILAPELDLVVHDGPHQSTFQKDQEKGGLRVDWEFVVWIPRNWHRLHNNPTRPLFSDQPGYRQPVPAPSIHAYFGGGSIHWKDVVVPKNIRILDERVGSAPIPGIDSGVIQGTVYDIATGQVITNAHIRAVMPSAQEPSQTVPPPVSTDARGAFLLKGIPGGYFFIEASAPGWAPRRLTRAFANPGKAFQSEAIQLSRAAKLSGRVSSSDGRPLSGIHIRLAETLGIDGAGYIPAGQKETMSDADGHFEFESLPEGFTQLRIDSQALHRIGDFFELVPIPSDSAQIVLEETGTVQGRVVSGKPVQVHVKDARGAIAGTWGGSMQCDDQGRFQFKGVPPGNYIISTRTPFSSDKIDSTAQRITVEGGKVTEVNLRD